MFCIKKEKLYIKIILFLIIAVYLGLCFASFAYHGNNVIMGSFEEFNNDDVKYLRSAWTLLETGKFTYRFVDKDTVFIMPGLTTVLAGFVAVFGKYPLLPFRIFQALMLAFGLYIIFLIGRKIFNSHVALIATFIMSIYAPSIYAPNTLFTESFFYFFFLMTFLFSVYALDTDKLSYYAWGGVFLGLATLFRPAIILFPLVIFVMWLIKKYSFIDMIVCGGTVVLIVCAILSPWIIRNAIIFKQFIPLTLSSGNPAMQGTFINYDQSNRENENINYYDAIKAKGNIDLSLFNKDEVVTDAVEREMAKIRLKELVPKDPWAYIKWYTVGKTIENWQKPFSFINLFGFKYQTLNNQHNVILMFAFGGLILFAIRRKFKGIAYIPIITILYFNFSHLPFYCFPRYMFPIMFCVVFYTAYFFYDISVTIKKQFVFKIQ